MFGQCFGSVQTLLGWDIPKNHGAFAPIEVVAPRGTIVNPEYPAPVSLNTTSGGAVVRFLVTNTGRRFGTDVPQLYLGIPSPAPGIVQPPRQLKGFRKVGLAAGRSAVVSLGVESGALAYWSEAARGWRVAPGCYGVMVGHSSRDISLRATLPVGGARCGGASRPSQHRRRHRHRHRRGHR